MEPRSPALQADSLPPKPPGKLDLEMGPGLFSHDSCHPMDCNLPGSSVHGILLARIPEWVAISFSRGSSQPRDWTQVSCTAGKLFTNGASREAYCPLICLFPKENKHCLLSVSIGSSSVDSAKCKCNIFNVEPVDTEGWL